MNESGQHEGQHGVVALMWRDKITLIEHGECDDVLILGRWQHNAIAHVQHIAVRAFRSQVSRRKIAGHGNMSHS